MTDFKKEIINGNANKKPKKVEIKYLCFNPANHKTAIPLIEINNAVPRSGWTITRPIGNKITIKETKIVYIEFTFSNFIL